MKRIPASQRSASLRCYYRRRRVRNLAAGLRSDGKPRSPKRAVFKWPPKVRAAKQRQWSRDANERLRKRNLAAGLTTNGTPRRNRYFPQLKGLATANRKEYQRQVYLILKARRTRAGLASLLGGSILAKLK